ncbi:hypothetical protein BLAT2472_20346 [Burkholderia latens]
MLRACADSGCRSLGTVYPAGVPTAIESDMAIRAVRAARGSHPSGAAACCSARPSA